MEPRILVVDDDRYVRSALKRLFQCYDWEVTTAKCGREALNLIVAGEWFNVVVADYYMPNVNGIDFIKQVNLHAPETFCVMLTAYPYCDAIEYALKKYLRATILQKPWDDSLLHLIEKALLLQAENKANQIS